MLENIPTIKHNEVLEHFLMDTTESLNCYLQSHDTIFPVNLTLPCQFYTNPPYMVWKD